LNLCFKYTLEFTGGLSPGFSRCGFTAAGGFIIGCERWPAEAGDGAAALRLVQGAHPDVVLMDVRMTASRPPGASSPAPAPPGCSSSPPSTLDEYAYVGPRADVGGFPFKDVARDGLLAAIRAVATSEAVVAPALSGRLLDAFLPHLPDPGRTPLPQTP
jgi:DNA-binding NarL/FixJ family response regulator